MKKKKKVKLFLSLFSFETMAMLKAAPPPPAHSFEVVDWKEVEEVIKGQHPVGSRCERRSDDFEFKLFFFAAGGSFAQVFRAHWRGRDVAVKKLKENMFESEAGGM